MSCRQSQPRHRISRNHICNSFCECKQRDSFSSGVIGAPLDFAQCNGGVPAIQVESYIGGAPGTTGSSLVSSAQLELCDKLQFWTEGTTELNVQEGSAQVEIEAANILCGSGDPTITPMTTRKFIYHDTTNNVLYAWPGSGPSPTWNQVSLGGGGTGTTSIMMLPDFWRNKADNGLPDGGNDTTKVIVHEANICVGVSGSVEIGTNPDSDSNLRISTITESAAIAIGNSAGQFLQSNNSIAIGNSAGQTGQGITGFAPELIGNSIAIGSRAGQNNQDGFSIAIGVSAGQTNQQNTAIAIGLGAGENSQRVGSIALGAAAGENNQRFNAIALGSAAGNIEQHAGSIALGVSAGQSNQGSTGVNSNFIGNSIAIGVLAASSGQRGRAIAIGYQAQLLNNAVDPGDGQAAIAIGNEAGKENQRENSIAIGNNAGILNLGVGSIAIGNGASAQNSRSICLGTQASSSVDNEFVVNLFNTGGTVDGLFETKFEATPGSNSLSDFTSITPTWWQVKINGTLYSIPMFTQSTPAPPPAESF